MCKEKKETPFSAIFSTDYAPKIGAFFNNWGAIEYSLTKGLAILLKIDDTRARMIFSEISALGLKLKLMRRLLKTQFVSNPERDRFLKLIADTQSLSATRNLYAHASWGSQGPDAQHIRIVIIPGTAPDDTEESIHQPRGIAAGEIQANVEKADALQNRWLEFFQNGAPKLTETPR
jgi:hypothetical protein